MANGQLRSIYGSNYRPVRQSSMIKDMRGQATADVIARKKKEQEERDRQFDQKASKDNLLLNQQQFKLSQDQAAEQARQGKIAMGINMGQLGLNMYDRFKGAGAPSASGSTFSNVGNALTSGLGRIGVSVPAGINLGNLAGSALAGGATGALLGDGKAGKSALYGAGAGLGMSLLNSGFSSGISNKLLDTGAGALGGLLGSLF